MQSLPGKNDTTSKILSWVITGGIGFGIFKLLQGIVPPLIDLAQNIVLLLAYVIPMFLIGGFIILNRNIIQTLLMGLSDKIVAAFIKMDPISVMKRYIVILNDKWENLNQTISTLSGKKIELDRQLISLKKERDNYQQSGLAAMRTNLTEEANLYAMKMTTIDESVDNLLPLSKRVDKNLELLQSLSKNWKFSLDRLTFEVANKEREYNIITQTFKGLKSAESMINSNNEEARNFGVSLKALEEKVTERMGYIEEFDRRSKPLMNQLSIEQGAMSEKGMQELEALLKGGNLELPKSFVNEPIKQTIQLRETSKNKFEL